MYNVVWQQVQLEATKIVEVLFSDVPNRISRTFAEKVLQRLHRGSTMLARSVVGNARFGFVNLIPKSTSCQCCCVIGVSRTGDERSCALENIFVNLRESKMRVASRNERPGTCTSPAEDGSQVVPWYGEDLDVMFIMSSKREVVRENATYFISLVKQKTDGSQRLMRSICRWHDVACLGREWV